MRSRLNTIFLLILIGICGCTADNGDPVIGPGKGSFVFQNDALNYGRPITIFSYMPNGYTPASPVLFVIHGNSRTAERYREAWIDIAEEHDALLLVPHFARQAGFPEDQHFNMGNMFEMDSLDNVISPNPEDDWS